VITTDASDPVIIEGQAAMVTEPARLQVAHPLDL
jgi:hypothetical protein